MYNMNSAFAPKRRTSFMQPKTVNNAIDLRKIDIPPPAPIIYVQPKPQHDYTVTIISIIIVLFVFVVLYYIIGYIKNNEIIIVENNTFIYPEGSFVEPDFTDYDFDTQGRTKYNWNTTSNGLTAICKFWTNSAGWINNTKFNSIALIAFADWITAYQEELNDTNLIYPGFKGCPWGNELDAFSFDSTKAVSYYLALNRDILKASAIDVILLLITNPQQSLGYKYYSLDSAKLLFPWVIANIANQTFDLNNAGFLYALNQFNLKRDLTLRGIDNGLHIDYAFTTRGGVFSFDVINDILPYYNDLVQLLPEIKTNLVETLDRINSFILHKTINLSGGVLWGIKPDISIPTYKGTLTTHKCVVIPSMSYIRFHGTNYKWSAKLSQPLFPYYECTEDIRNMGLYSCFCRKLFTNDDVKTPTEFTPGFFYDSEMIKLTAVSTGAIIPTKYTPTTGAGFNSWVFTDGKDWGAASQKRLYYSPLMSTFISVKEYIYINIKEETILLFFNFEKSENSTRIYKLYWPTDSNYEASDSRNLHSITGVNTWYRCTIDCKTATYTCKTFDGANNNLYVNTNNKYKQTRLVTTTNTTYNLITYGSNDEPYCLIPAADWILEDEFLIPLTETSILARFKYDEILNQYIYTGVKQRTSNYDNYLKTKLHIEI